MDEILAITLDPDVSDQTVEYLRALLVHAILVPRDGAERGRRKSPAT